MAEEVPQGTGAENPGAKAVSAAELFRALGEVIHWWSVSDDPMGTNEVLVRAVLKAVATHKRDGQIVHLDKAGRRVTARHLRLGAASARLMAGLRAYKRGIVELSGLAAEVQADFSLDIGGFLQDKVAANAGASRKVKDIANLASEIVSLAAKRRDPEFKAASARFIQTTRGLYKDALATIAAGRQRIQDAVAARLPPPLDTKAEQDKEHHAWAIKMGFEQAFTWQEDAAATPKEALKAVGKFRLLLHRLGGEEAMRKELYTFESCAAFVVQAYGLDPECFSVVPQLKAQSPQPIYFRQLLCVGHRLDVGYSRVSCCGRLNRFPLGSFPDKAVEHHFEDAGIPFLHGLADKRGQPPVEHAGGRVVPDFFKLSYCALQKRSPNLSNLVSLEPAKLSQYPSPLRGA